MNNRVIFWLRSSYWLGAIVNVVAGLMMLIPGFLTRMNGLGSFNPGLDFCFVAGMGAPLIFGWSFLLLWLTQCVMTVLYLFGYFFARRYEIPSRRSA